MIRINSSSQIKSYNSYYNKIVNFDLYKKQQSDSGHRGKYISIVGNGINSAERSNAHTLDWDGIGWFQGGLQVGGNAQDDGARNVLLEGDIPQSDWAQNDETAADYIKNRTHWSEGKLIEIIPNQTIITEDDGGVGYLELARPFEFKEGTYTVNWNGKSYQFDAIVENDGEFTFYLIGNTTFFGVPTAANTDCEFGITNVYQNNVVVVTIIYTATAGTYTFNLSKGEETVHKLDGKFLPEGVPYLESSSNIYLPETTIEISEVGIRYSFKHSRPLIAGLQYNVNFNGTIYECIAKNLYGENNCLGNESLQDITISPGNEPFCIVVYDNNDIDVYTTEAGTFTLSIEEIIETIHPLKAKYIQPDIQLTIDSSTGEVIANTTYAEISKLTPVQLMNRITIEYSNAEYNDERFVPSSIGFSRTRHNGESLIINFETWIEQTGAADKYSKLIIWGEDGYINYIEDSANSFLRLCSYYQDTTSNTWVRDNYDLKINKNGLLGISSDVGTTYLTPAPATAQVGQFLKVSAVDETGKPIEYEAVNMGNDIEIDTTLAVEGKAADAKATGDAINAVSALVGDISVAEQIHAAIQASWEASY